MFGTICSLVCLCIMGATIVLVFLLSIAPIGAICLCPVGFLPLICFIVIMASSLIKKIKGGR